MALWRQVIHYLNFWFTEYSKTCDEGTLKKCPHPGRCPLVAGSGFPQGLENREKNNGQGKVRAFYFGPKVR